MEELLKQLITNAVQDALSDREKSESELQEVLTIEEMTKYLKISRVTLMGMIEEGLPHFKIGNQYRFNREDIREWRLNQSSVTQKVASSRNTYKIVR